MERQGVKAIGRSISLERCKAVLGEVEMRLIICACRLYGNNLLAADFPLEILKGEAACEAACRNRRHNGRFAELAPEVDLARALALAPERKCGGQVGNRNLCSVPRTRRCPLAVHNKTVVRQKRIGVDCQGVKAVLFGICLDRADSAVRKGEARLIRRADRTHALNLLAADLARVALKTEAAAGKGAAVDNAQPDILEGHIDVGTAFALAPERVGLRQRGNVHIRGFPLRADVGAAAHDKGIVRQVCIGMDAKCVKTVFFRIGLDVCNRSRRELEARLIGAAADVYALDAPAADLSAIRNETA